MFSPDLLGLLLSPGYYWVPRDPLSCIRSHTGGTALPLPTPGGAGISLYLVYPMVSLSCVRFWSSMTRQIAVVSADRTLGKEYFGHSRGVLGLSLGGCNSVLEEAGCL